MNTQNLLTKKNIIGLAIALTLLIAIPLGIYLAQQTQIFKPRASETLPPGPPTIKVTGCTGDPCTVTGDKVDLELTSPLGPPQPSGLPLPGGCLDVLTPARNNTSGECRTFTNICVPDGWTKITTPCPSPSPAASPSPSASPGGG